MILESWRRCSAMQVSPLLRNAPLAVIHEDQLRRLLEGSQLFLRAAHPVMKRLSDFLDGYVIVLSDANGCLLKIVGDMKTRRRLARIDFVPGGDWSEAAAGTNALGTAITDGHVVQLLGAEHYCEGWQDLACTAAPIRHPLSGEMLGTLDVTGNYHLIRPFLSSFIAAAALQVQQEIHALLLSADKGRTKTQSTPSRSSTRETHTSCSTNDRHQTGALLSSEKRSKKAYTGQWIGSGNLSGYHTDAWRAHLGRGASRWWQRLSLLTTPI
jgi:transcriptional regulator of acetoin/glycerol metabolism